MGANFCIMSIPATTPEKEVRDQFARAQDDDRYENGHSYSGGLGMATGLLFIDREFPTFKEAMAFLQEDCVKWEEARAVRHGNLDGSKSYLIGAMCAS